MQGQRVMWKDMSKPVSLEEHAGAPIAPTPRPDLPTDVSENVIIQAERPQGEGDDWEVRAYFTNPIGLGGLAGPSPGAHTGFKVYRGGKFQYSLDGGPTIDLRNASKGNLRFEGSLHELEKNNAGIKSLGEFKITPPQGVSGEEFARRMANAAQAYDGSLPYKLPGLGHMTGAERYGGETSLFPVGNEMSPGEFNSNSFAAGILRQAGAGSSTAGIQDHLRQKNWAAPGLEAPVPSRYFSPR